jgi:hypothetical protein
MLAFRTLGKKRLLSSTSLPPRETRVREQAAAISFFRSLPVLWWEDFRPRAGTPNNAGSCGIGNPCVPGALRVVLHERPARRTAKNPVCGELRDFSRPSGGPRRSLVAALTSPSKNPFQGSQKSVDWGPKQRLCHQVQRRWLFADYRRRRPRISARRDAAGYPAHRSAHHPTIELSRSASVHALEM